MAAIFQFEVVTSGRLGPTFEPLIATVPKAGIAARNSTRYSGLTAVISRAMHQWPQCGKPAVRCASLGCLSCGQNGLVHARLLLVQHVLAIAAYLGCSPINFTRAVVESIAGNWN